MSFSEERLDLGIDYGAIGGPGYLTEIVVYGDVREKRFIKLPESKGEWEVGDRNITKNKLQYIINFFHARKGRAIGFRYKDWNDYEASNENIGTGDDVTIAFQLIKTYASGSDSTIKTIEKPVAGIQIFIDGVEQLSGWTINLVTGVVTFSIAPGAGLAVTWTGEFDIPVRFDADKFKAEFVAFDIDTKDAIYYLPSLTVVEDPQL